MNGESPSYDDAASFRPPFFDDELGNYPTYLCDPNIFTFTLQNVGLQTPVVFDKARSSPNAPTVDGSTITARLTLGALTGQPGDFDTTQLFSFIEGDSPDPPFYVFTPTTSLDWGPNALLGVVINNPYWGPNTFPTYRGQGIIGTRQCTVTCTISLV